ncbi:hypothetical protein L1049_017499 [Liquidambar formosana]|uniref:Pentatricopeptide repeat-containing protein n=1 Tax=Liquidambar formosana TaxID=63359 RepID=A0AAP0X7E7_LIQFO
MASTLCLSPPVSATPDYATFTTQNESQPTAEDSFGIGSLKICKNMNELKQLHCHLTKKGLNHNPSAMAKLITACVEMGIPESLTYARKAFELFKEDEATTGTAFMYNSFIRGYSCSKLIEEAIFLYIEMVAQGVTPDHYTFPFVLSACTKIAAFREGIQVHGVVFKMGLQEDVFIENSLIHFYSECGEIACGRKVFDGMPKRNVVSWTSLICGYARRDCPKEALSLFFEMVAVGIKPNSVTMVCVISACAKLQDLAMGERVCAYISNSGLKLNAVMLNALVDMYMKCGAIDTAKRLFDECTDRNLVLYNSILSNYVRQGLAREALGILDANVA